MALKYILLYLTLFTAILSCSKAGKAVIEPVVPKPSGNALVGTSWKHIYRQENNLEIYSLFRFVDGATLEVLGNDNDQRIEKTIMSYKYTYEATTKTVKYAFEERPGCQGIFSDSTLTVSCNLQGVFKKVL